MPDTLNENFGLNYLMDGYPDMAYGKGVREGDGDIFPLADHDMDSLPESVAGEREEEEDVLNDPNLFQGPLGDSLGDTLMIMASGPEAPLLTFEGIVDHHWLSDAEQDPARLPKQGDIISQLQQLWGNTRTDGIFRVPATDLVEAEAVQDGVTQLHRDEVEQRHEDDVNRLLRTASRLVVAGKSPASLEAYAQGSWEQLKPYMEALEGERGLLGPVYLYASAYPRLHRGRWSKPFAKAAKRARYLVAGATIPHEDWGRIQEDTGLEVVAQVGDIPWRGLCQAVTKTKAATVEEAKKALAAHYLAPNTYQGYVFDGQRSVHQTPSERISMEVAEKEFSAYTPTQITLPTLQERAAREEKKAALATLQRWTKAGLLPKKAAQRCVEHVEVSPQEALKSASALILQLQNSTYHGEGLSRSAGVSEADAWAQVEAAKQVQQSTWKQAWAKKALEKVQADFDRRSKALTKMVRAKLLAPAAAERLLHDPRETRVVLREASQEAIRTRELSYSGPHKVQDPVPVTDQDVARVHAEASEKAAATRRVIAEEGESKVLREKMALLEKAFRGGMMGQEFTKFVTSTLTQKQASQLWPYLGPLVRRAKEAAKAPSVSTRQYSEPVKTAYVGREEQQPSLTRSEKAQAIRKLLGAFHEGRYGQEALEEIPKEVRKQASSELSAMFDAHDGRAGHLYVMSSLYASPTGTEGCVEGAKQHRSSEVRQVLAMDRCRGCTSRNVLDICTKYNKPLLWEVPVDAPRMARKARAKQASAQVVDPVQEFDLRGLDGISFKEKEAPSTFEIDLSRRGGLSW